MNTDNQEIKSNDFLLRQFTENDLQDVFKGLSNKEVIKYYGISFETLEAAKEQIKWFSEIKENETGIWWAICSLDDSKFYGACGFSSIDKKFKKAEIGFWLLPEHWGKGIISKAVPLICEYGFNILELHRIEALVETENINCKTVMKKLNFHHDGRLRECEIKDGKYIDLDIYSKLSTD